MAEIFTAPKINSRSMIVRQAKTTFFEDSSKNSGVTSGSGVAFWFRGLVLQLSGLSILEDLGNIKANSLETQFMNDLTFRN